MKPIAFMSRLQTSSAILVNALMFGSAFTLMELIAASYQQYWVAGTWGQWIGTAAALCIYSTVIGAGATVVIAMLWLVPRARDFAQSLIPSIAGAIAFAIWFVVRGRVPNSESIGWVAAPIAFLLVPLAVRLFKCRGVRLQSAILVAVASAAMTFTLVAVPLTFETSGTQFATRHALVWLGILAAPFTLLAAVDARRSIATGSFAVVVFVLAAAYPFAQIVRGIATTTARASDSPNVLLITIDTLRADALALYGGDVETPAIDAVAQDGMVFERCYSLSPWTIPSINGMLTSRYPPGLTPHASHEERQQQGLSYGALTEYWLDKDGTTFFDRLSGRYQTIAINGNPTLDSQRWLFDRFDRYFHIDALNDLQPRWFQNAPILRAVLAEWWPRVGETRYVDTTALISEYAGAYLGSPRRKPFFMWIHYMDPHGPYSPPRRYRQTGTPWPRFPPKKGFTVQAADRLTNSEKKYARSLYNGEIAYVDTCVGSVIHRLRSEGLYDSTIIAITADHGESFWDHQGWGHAYDFYDEQMHVPFIIAGPGIRPDRISGRVSAIDLLPTIAELLHIEPSPEWRGLSLAGASSTSPDRPCFAQATSFAPYNPEPRQMIVDGEWKLIEGLESGELRLFDLDSDPEERLNVASKSPEVRDSLIERLHKWRASFPASFAEFEKFQPIETDEDFIERMRALGYIAP